MSLLTGRAVRPGVGMTGEVTLQGRVLPIGGVKQKVLAAQRAGLDTVILPQRNGPDLDDVPEAVREVMTFHLVDDVRDVLQLALDDELDGEEDARAASSAPAVRLAREHPTMNESDAWVVRAIGTVSSARDEVVDDDWGEVEARITLLPPYGARSVARARCVQPHRGRLRLRPGGPRVGSHRRAAPAAGTRQWPEVGDLRPARQGPPQPHRSLDV